eukprot:CAMPEP_0201513280 /NCGR_PEP_ID=MMETSP0161_2-20130828/5355_1 /ASSEMBLY_ACC=CAM_ASM_000251 /TAXON_ID=180227 /ORGANISM="Neoparamoeba aestuarina, Strain SoJaBio B1-5/56/2" /LENGTH=140 /DNA_ID=CAMNT_0047909427 /DNA_START=283 /DNA_END=702 /DNA_ORIENTATION=-
MAQTDTILESDVPIDSAIIGMTAMVYVNGSAITIELGHQGAPVEDVILRIYRETERDLDTNDDDDDDKRRDRMEREYEKRLTVIEDDCDTTISCSYYEGNGLLSTAGCETVDVTDEYVDCACDHYSNFGLLFLPCSSEGW